MQYLSTSYINEGSNQIVIYQTEDGHTQIDVRLEIVIVLLTENRMAKLFQLEKKMIPIFFQKKPPIVPQIC